MLSMDDFKKKVLATKDHPKMIKSGTFNVVVNPEEKNRKEALFSQWVHTYPLHEHEKHWAVLTGAEKDEKPTVEGKAA